MESEPIRALRERLKDLNTKAYYLLVALSFSYRVTESSWLRVAFALTAIVAVLPVQDYVKSKGLLELLRAGKVLFLGAALFCTLAWLKTAMGMPTPTLTASTSAPAAAAKPVDQTSRLSGPEGEYIKMMNGCQNDIAASRKKLYTLRRDDNAALDAIDLAMLHANICANSAAEPLRPEARTVIDAASGLNMDIAEYFRYKHAR